MQRIDQQRLDRLARQAAESPRRRANDNLHPRLDDPVQRFLNALEPGTYVRPHRHPGERWEMFLVLQGKVVVVCLDAGGTVVEREILQAGGGVRGVEVPAGTWHSLASLEPGTVLLELKPGPYAALTDKDFAGWAPAEGHPAARDLEQWLCSAQPGERWEAPPA